MLKSTTPFKYLNTLLSAPKCVKVGCMHEPWRKISREHQIWSSCSQVKKTVNQTSIQSYISLCITIILGKLFIYRKRSWNKITILQFEFLQQIIDTLSMWEKDSNIKLMHFHSQKIPLDFKISHFKTCCLLFLNFSISSTSSPVISKLST